VTAVVGAKAMLTILLTASMLATVTTPGSGAGAPRCFLVLHDQTLEVVDGKLVFDRWPVARRWDSDRKIPIETIEGLEFPHDRAFWQSVERKSAEADAMPQIKVTEQGELSYRGDPVDVGIGVVHMRTALRWKDWVVGVGAVVNKKTSPNKEPERTIKGPVWYAIWFDTKTRKGSYRQISTVGPLPLRIYCK
jgi:hypothetical protein